MLNEIISTEITKDKITFFTHKNEFTKPFIELWINNEKNLNLIPLPMDEITIRYDIHPFRSKLINYKLKNKSISNLISLIEFDLKTKFFNNRPIDLHYLSSLIKIDNIWHLQWSEHV